MVCINEMGVIFNDTYCSDKPRPTSMYVHIMGQLHVSGPRKLQRIFCMHYNTIFCLVNDFLFTCFVYIALSSCGGGRCFEGIWEALPWGAVRII